MKTSLKKQTVHALGWSTAQNWGMKLVSFLVFFVLVRYLKPAELGLAQAVILILAFVEILSEQGFQNAIIQRKELQPDDLNLPFLASMSIAVISSAALILFSKDIALALQVEGAEHLIAASAVIPPITAASGFEIAMRRRTLDFKVVAFATLISSLLSGAVALLLAVFGFGATSLIAQAIVAACVTLVILRRTPLWKPNRKFITSSFRGLLSFGSHIFLSKLIDFFSAKIIDLIILSRFGLTSLGIFAVGSRLYLTILLLLASPLVDVTLSAMAKISNDAQRFKTVYLRFIFIACCTTLPIFISVAALAPEVCRILFGDQWDGADIVTRWLCILGAVQVVQFFNNSTLGAAGKPNQIFLINLIKFAMGSAVLWFSSANTISEVTLYFVMSQLAVAPVSFALGMHVAGASLGQLLKQILPGLFAAALAFLATSVARTNVIPPDTNVFIAVLLLGLIYLTVILAVLWITSSRKLIENITYLVGPATPPQPA